MVRRHFWIMNRPFVRLLSRLKIERAQVLDIGMGPGWIPIALSQRHPQWQMCGLDASEDRVRRARRNALASGAAETIRFTAGSATDLPFPDASFDLVISHFTLHHLEDPLAMLNEAARVVRPG